MPRVATVCVLLAAALAARADDFWKHKPPREWTVQESLQILQNSPWARQQMVATAPAAKDADMRVSTGAANCTPDAVDANGNCLEHRIQLPRDPSQSPEITFSNFTYAVYLMRWESGAPVAAAFQRLEELGERAGAAYQSPPPRRPADRYVVTIKVLRPAGNVVDPFAERADSKEKQRVRLKTSRGTFAPLESERSGVGATAAVHFFFPRQQDGQPILNTKGDTAEFFFEGAKVSVKCRFSLDADSLR